MSRSEAVRKAWITRKKARLTKASHAYVGYQTFADNRKGSSSFLGMFIDRAWRKKGHGVGRAEVLPGGGVKLTRRLASLGFKGMIRKLQPMTGKPDRKR